MTTPSFKTAEALGAAWHAPAGGPLAPVGAHGAAAAQAPQETATRSSRGNWSRALRVARDLAIGLALIAAIPLSVIGVSGRWLLGYPDVGRERMVEVERLRPLTVPSDPSITPSAAGAAMRRLLPVAASPAFPVPADRVDDEPWESDLPPGLFTDLPGKWWKGPDATKIITAAAKGLTPAEQAWLNALAESPTWRDVDLVARAARVDVLEQRFQLPFRDDAVASAMPIPSLQRGRRLAHAGVARAAYYVSIGDRERAESVLRNIVALGFASIDNGPLWFDGMIGRVMIDAGRDGLRQLYALEGRSELLALTEPPAARAPRQTTRGADRSLATIRATALRNFNDPALPRGYRFEQLGTLAWSTCSNVRSVLAGPSSETQQAFETARSSLARSDAERQYIDLLERNVTDLPNRPAVPGVVAGIIQGAASVTSAVTGNERIAGCTRVLTGIFIPR